MWPPGHTATGTTCERPSGSLCPGAQLEALLANLTPPGPCQGEPLPTPAPTTLSPSPGRRLRAGQTEGYLDTGTEAQVRVTLGAAGDLHGPLGSAHRPGGVVQVGSCCLASGDSALISSVRPAGRSLVGAGRCPGRGPTLCSPCPLSEAPAPCPRQSAPGSSWAFLLSRRLWVSSVAAGFRFFHIFHLRALPTTPGGCFRASGSPREWALSLPRSLFSFRGAGICSSCVNPEACSRPR